MPLGGAQAVAAVFGVLVSPWMACHLFGLYFGTRRVLGLGLDKSSPDGLFFLRKVMLHLFLKEFEHL